MGSCGPGKLGDWIVPDKPFGLDLSKACEWHDQAYRFPEGKTKEVIDHIFYSRMMWEVSKHSGWRKRLYRVVARIYFWAVTRGHLSWWLSRRRENRRMEKTTDGNSQTQEGETHTP